MEIMIFILCIVIWGVGKDIEAGLKDIHQSLENLK